MATVTPNFNWPVPTSTDLVKDGATAIEALGDSIDASLVDLKGGTTGQVLSKTSGTDMDFTWVAQDDSNAIQNSIVNAKGDLIGASANDTPAILSVGANGETLVADNSTSTGLRWQAPVNSNPVLNSAFQIWQRGTSFTNPASSPAAYCADRWQAFRGAFAGGITTSRQNSGITGIQYAARIQRNSGNTDLDQLFLLQNFESVNSIPYAGKTVTFSFYAKVGANYSGGNVNARLVSGTGTDENYLTGTLTGLATVIDQSVTMTTSYQRFTYTGTVANNVTQLAMRFSYTPTGTSGANDWLEITGVQLEVGSVATPFKTYAGTIQGELAACQRYYWRTTAQASSTDNILPYGSGISTTEVQVSGNFPVRMRTNPTTIEWAGLRTYDGTSFVTVTGVTLGTSTFDGYLLSLAGASGMVQYRPTQTRSTSSSPANSYVGFSAEL